jgi:hypothetical protein
MRKGFLACTCSLWTSAAIGFALWAGASGAALSQETTTPAPVNAKPGEPAKADATRPGFVQRALGRLFRRPQTQVQSSVVPAPTPSSAVGASMPKSTATEAQESPIRSVSATSEQAPIPASPTLPYAKLLEVSGHDDNYTWITGVLIRKPGLPNVWFITYLPPDAIPDLHRGCVTVQTNVSMKEFHEGDLVTVIGYIITNVEVAPNQRVTGFAAEQVNQVK